jgi:predicted nucleic acid-binding Zn ribbon protein
MQRAHNVARAKRKRIGHKDCIVCGKAYHLSTYSGGQKTCSEACALRRKRELTKGYNAKYRTPEYRALAKQRRQEAAASKPPKEARAPRMLLAVVPRPDDMQTCTWCGEDFEGLHDDAYCSDECRWDDIADRQRQGAR